MRGEVRTALLSIISSVALSGLGGLFLSGQYVAQVDQNTGDIEKLQASDTQMKDLVTQIRIEMAEQNATVTTKLDTVINRLEK